MRYVRRDGMIRDVCALRICVTLLLLYKSPGSQRPQVVGDSVLLFITVEWAHTYILIVLLSMGNSKGGRQSCRVYIAEGLTNGSPEWILRMARSYLKFLFLFWKCRLSCPDIVFISFNTAYVLQYKLIIQHFQGNLHP